MNISSTAFYPILDWKLSPGTYQDKPSHSLIKHNIHVNSLDLRNEELASPKSDSKIRILVLGDSFEFGRWLQWYPHS